MFRKLFKGVFKLCVYSGGLIILAGVWDYTQQRQAIDGDYTVAEYATSVSDRYGPRVNQLATIAAGSADAGLATGVDWVKSAGVLDKFGVDPSVQDMPAAATLEPQKVTSLDDLISLASVHAVSAPETSLFPRARAVQ